MKFVAQQLPLEMDMVAQVQILDEDVRILLCTNALKKKINPSLWLTPLLFEHLILYLQNVFANHIFNMYVKTRFPIK